MDDDSIEDAENPFWTEEDFKRARPAPEVLPAWAARALVREVSDIGVRSGLRGQSRWARQATMLAA